MTAAVPDVGSLWHFPRWTNKCWQGPWRVDRIGEAQPNAEWTGTVVYLERVDGPPEGWSSGPHEVELSRWPAGWEPWPEVPDYPPAAA